MMLQFDMTLNQIRSHHPCTEGWAKLLKHLGKTAPDDEPLSLLTVLESNGLDDAIWCLRTEPTPERIQRFALAMARRVEHLTLTSKDCNDVTERYLNGRATRKELDAARASCRHVTAVTVADTVYAAAVRETVDGVCDATYATTVAAHTASYLATRVTAGAAAEAAYNAERQAQEQLFKEFFA
jgi:hypothetical protein